MTDRDDSSAQPLRDFTRCLLEDLQALERMIDEGAIESGVRRVGAEQEVFLVDRAMRPMLSAMEILDRTGHPQVTNELGLFNLEINLTPQPFEGSCLRRMELEIEQMLDIVQKEANSSGSRVLLTGILPTMRQEDLGLNAMTPRHRYRELNRAALEHRGGSFRVAIKGLDELNVTHDNVLFEACNTSFQVHFQVGPDEFARLYNLAQAITAPVIAVAANSPVFLQHRLWHETRVALFQQSVDSRSDTLQARRARPRVSFGDRWVDRSILEIYRDDIARFHVFLASAPSESPLRMLDNGEVPRLAALCQHNGTVYRWNRPCYGLHENKPHLRIEHRVLPAGPTVVDEVANAAFYLGLMTALSEEHEDVTRVMSFDDAKSNFMAAARYGLHARFRWFEGRSCTADDLILKELAPRARAGLRSKNVSPDDIERYMGVLEERVRTGRTGAQWALDSLAALGERNRPEERHHALAACMYVRQLEGHPVHTWELARLGKTADWRNSIRTVEQVMTTDLFTVHPEDLVDLAASLMDWEHIRHVPVEDRDGHLVGLVSHRQLLRLVGRGLLGRRQPTAVRDIMTLDPITVEPRTATADAIALMRKHRVSCLPVINGRNKLVGIVTERDFIGVAARLLDEELRED